MKSIIVPMIMIVLSVMLVCSSVGYAENTEFTFVGGSSSRPDSDVQLALASGSYVYTPLNLLIGSSYNCSYKIWVNNTIVYNGTIDITQRAFISFTIDFPISGQQDFRVNLGDDIYAFRVFVLKRSFEEEVVDRYDLVNASLPVGAYFQKDLIKVFSASLCGMAIAIFVAYWFKIDKIKQEPRRIL